MPAKKTAPKPKKSKVASKKSSSKKPKKVVVSPPSLKNFILFLVDSPLQLATFILISLIFLSLPGQNYFQTLNLNSQARTAISQYNINLYSPIPVLPPEIAPPPLTAQGVIVVDLNSSTVLYDYQSDLRLLPASTTKIMTALVTLTDYPLSDLVTVTNANQAIGQKAELIPGETLTVHDLLYALLLDSGNDAAVTLAQHHPQGYYGFINRMNELARELSLTSTNFENSSGIESPNHFTTARDLYLLTKEALKNPTFAQIVATESQVITSTDGRYAHWLQNLNQLLGRVEGVKGVKTGWTETAGECLISYVERDGHRILIVVLGSQDRFGESQSLIEWVFSSYTWIEPQDFLELISNTE
jgi:D-alanyl-D-alanine carboxypeptidase